MRKILKTTFESLFSTNFEFLLNVSPSIKLYTDNTKESESHSAPKGPQFANISGTSGDDNLTGTSDDDTIDGLEGNDTIDGGAGDDIIFGGAGADTLTGGTGSDVFDSRTGNAADNTLSQFNGDTITDFSFDDVIIFTSGFASVSNYTFTSDGMGGGTLDMAGNILAFENIAANAEFITVEDRIVGSEVYLYNVMGMNWVIDEDRFEFVTDVDIADLTINSGVTVGADPSGGIPTARGDITFNNGVDINVVNNGTTEGIHVQSINGSIVNNGVINEAQSGIILRTQDPNQNSTLSVTNASGAQIISALSINISGSSGTFTDHVFVNNEGLMQSTFRAFQGAADETFTLTNSGQITNVTGAGLEASLGVLVGAMETTITNSGLIEVQDANGGSVGLEALAVGFSGQINSSEYNLVNSGTILSTGAAVGVGSVSDNDTIFEVNIHNTQSGVITSDTNNNLGEAAILGRSNFIIANLPGEVNELLVVHNINNDGTINGDIDLYQFSYFQLNGTIGFTSVDGRSVGALYIPGVEDPILQVRDAQGNPIYDDDGNPFFYPGQANVAGLGLVNYEVIEGVPSVTDLNGDPIFLLPDSDDITRSAFADTIVNSDTGVINGDVFLGVGNDSFLAQGNGLVTGTVFGGLGNDTLTGANSDDRLSGGDGADTLIGGLGADVLDGGAGFDTVDYRGAALAVRFNVDTGGTMGEADGDTYSGIERYYLTDSSDVVTGSNANEFFFGGGGNDQINGGGGIDRIYGGDGNDIQRGDAGNDTLYGSAGSDQLNGGTGTDTANYQFASSAVTLNLASGGTLGDAAGDTYFGIESVTGSQFDDSLTGNSSGNLLNGGNGDDILDGAGGNDVLIGGAGADVLIGGAGVDTASYTTAAAGVGVNLLTGGLSGDAAGDSYVSIEAVLGSSHNDSITGDGGDNRLDGRDGDDVLDGAGGNDRLLGGDGNDTLSGGDGIDTIFGQDGDDILSGGDGNDFFFGGAGADSHDGGTGTDTVSYLNSSGGLTIDMGGVSGTGDAAGDSFVNVERIFGSAFDDAILGDGASNTLFGNGGDDYLTGGAGNDSLFGGAGLDSYGFNTANDGADVINGFGTNELIYILGGDPAFDSWAELQAVAVYNGANTVFNFGGGNLLTLIGVDIADLSAANFDFSDAPPASAELPDTDKGDILVAESLVNDSMFMSEDEGLLGLLNDKSSLEYSYGKNADGIWQIFTIDDADYFDFAA